MKKILYIHHGKGLGGAGLSLLHMVRALDKTQYHPIVLFLCADQKLIDLYRSYNIETVGPLHLMDFSHTVMQWYRWHQIKFFVRSFWATIKTWWWYADYWYDQVKPDIVHLNTSSLIAWAHRAYRKKIPVIFHIREPLASGYFGLRRWLVRTCIDRWATRIVGISKNEALPWAHRSKTQVIYNAVDPEWFQRSEEQIPVDLPTVLFLGGYAPEKGTLTILQALERVKKEIPGVRLVIAGYFNVTHYPRWHPRSLSGEERYAVKVEKMLQTLGSCVEIVGPRHDVPQLMQQSSVVVFPAMVGHFARPIIEAGFVAKPVVSSDFAPLDELVVNGKTGFLVPAQDIEQWADKIRIILKDQKLRNRMGQEAYNFCKTNFCLSDQIKKIEKLYQSYGN